MIDIPTEAAALVLLDVATADAPPEPFYVNRALVKAGTPGLHVWELSDRALHVQHVATNTWAPLAAVAETIAEVL